jgi:uncharacterized repeat protein (TIGR01451 family)
MSLKDVEKKMNKLDGRMELDEERQETSEYSVYGKDDVKDEPANYESFQTPEPSFFEKYKQKIIIGMLSVLGVLTVGAAIWGGIELNSRRYSPERVTVAVEGPTDVVAGEEVEYTIRYTNNAFVDLINPRLTVELPEALIDENLTLLGQDREEVRNFELPTIEARTEGSVTVKGRLIGEEGSIHFVRAVLNYTPSGVSSSFDTNRELATTIQDSPLVVDVQTPLEAASGDTVRYQISIKNDGKTDLTNLELRMEYPEGFTYISSDYPISDGDNSVFAIDRLESEELFEIIIDGTLEGEVDAIQVLKVQVGLIQDAGFTLFATNQNSTKMAEPYIALSQSIEGRNSLRADAGETITYTVNFRNNTDVRIGEGALSVKLDSPLFDLSTVRANGADFDASNNTLTWFASRVPELEALAPNQSGEVQFRVRIIDRVPIQTFNDVNYILNTTAQFESEEVPTPLGVNKIITANTTEVKLNTRLLTDTKLFFQDSASTIVNSGPLPPKVNQTTTFTLYWEVQNLTNDVNGVKMTTTLPANVQWTGQFNTNGVGSLSYNERTKQIEWNIGEVPANTGILRPVYRAIFQVSLTPAPNQIGESPKILDPINVTGTDTFTQRVLDTRLNDVILSEIEDPSNPRTAVEE